MIQVAFVDGDACVAVLGHQVDGILDGLLDLDRDQVGARDHEFAHAHIPHLEDAVDHLPLFFLDHAFFLADCDQQLELFFGYERATYLRLAAEQPEDQTGDSRQNVDNGPHHDSGTGDQRRQA